MHKYVGKKRKETETEPVLQAKRSTNRSVRTFTYLHSDFNNCFSLFIYEKYINFIQ